jgi:hypothetical protein
MRPVTIGRKKLDTRGKRAGGTEDRSDSFGGGKLPRLKPSVYATVWPRGSSQTR